MLTKRLKLLVSAVGLFALAGMLIQQARIERLATEAATLRVQLQQQASVQNEPERPVEPWPDAEARSNSAPPVAGEPSHETLRLRGEVGVLKGQLADSVARGVSQRTQYQVVAAQLDSANAEATKANIRASTDEMREVRLLAVAQKTLGDLASALNVPESVSKLSFEERSRDESLKRYELYFFFKRGCEEMQKVVEDQKKAQASAQ